MDDSKRSLRTIFNEALEIEDAQARAEYLSRTCVSDPSLQKKIEELIDADAAAGGFLAPADEQTDNSATAPVTTLTEESGDRIGHYKLLQKIGEGGCGVVYMAEQEEPVRRRVAPAGEGEVLAAFSPREPLLAFSMETNPTTTNAQNRVRLWNGATQKIVAELALGGLCVGLEFSADRQALITSTANEDNQITLWRVPEGRKLIAYPAPQQWSSGTPFAVARDLSAAAHAMPDGRLRVIDLATGKERWSAKAADETVTALAISPDGKTLASGAGFVESAIRLWDFASGREIKRLRGHRAWVSHLVFWPDDKTLASASADQTIRLWDITSLQPLRTLRGHQLEVNRLTLLRDNRTLVSGCKDGSVYAWDTAAIPREPRARTCVILPAAVAAWRFYPDSKSVLTCDRQGRVAEWQGADFKKVQPLLEEIGTNILAACLSDDCRLLALAFTNGTVQVWDLQRRALLHRWTGPMSGWPSSSLVFLSQGKQLLIVHRPDNSIHVWDVRTGQETKSWMGPPHSFAAAVSPDERWCLALGWKGASLLREMATGVETSLDIREPFAAAFSPDGKVFAAASGVGFVKLWETTTRRETATFRGFLLGVHSVAFSPDGKRLAAGSAGQEAIKLWDVESQQELLALEGQGSVFISSAFSPDGNFLGSMNLYDRTLHLWRAPSWAEIDAAEQVQ